MLVISSRLGDAALSAELSNHLLLTDSDARFTIAVRPAAERSPGSRAPLVDEVLDRQTAERHPAPAGAYPCGRPLGTLAVDGLVGRGQAPRPCRGE